MPQGHLQVNHATGCTQDQPVSRSGRASPRSGSEARQRVLDALPDDACEEARESFGVPAEQVVARVGRDLRAQVLGDAAKLVDKRLRAASSPAISARSSATGSSRAALGLRRGEAQRIRPGRSRRLPIPLAAGAPSSATRSASARKPTPTASRRQAETRDEMLALRRSPRALQRGCDPLRRLRQSSTPAQSTATRPNSATLVGRSSMKRPVVAHGDQRRRFRPGLVDVAPLRIARHDDRRPAPVDRRSWMWPSAQ